MSKGKLEYTEVQRELHRFIAEPGPTTGTGQAV